MMQLIRKKTDRNYITEVYHEWSNNSDAKRWWKCDLTNGSTREREGIETVDTILRSQESLFSRKWVFEK